MHVVDVCAFYSPQGGGVKTYVERKVRAARRHGVRMTILAPARSGEAFTLGDGDRVLTIPGRRFPLDGRYRYFHDEPALHAALDELAPDFVEASSPWSSAGMVARWPGKAPRALVMHADSLASYAYRWFGRVFTGPRSTTASSASGTTCACSTTRSAWWFAPIAIWRGAWPTAA